MKHQNQYPVIFITLKEMQCQTYNEQVDHFADIITDLYEQHIYIKDSSSVSQGLKKRFMKLYDGEGTIVNLKNSLKLLTHCLYQHYHKKAIILIDEYDVPLSKAYSNGYFKKMAKYISGVFLAGLKANNYLEKGVFTGLNNFNVYSITEYRASDRFGFTFDEVKQLCHYYNIDDKIDIIKDWYDGYLFGNTGIYNP